MTNAVQPDWPAQADSAAPLGGAARPGGAALPGGAASPGGAALHGHAALPGGAARPDERQSQYVPVQCRECGATVLAAKFSVQHTSVQWDAAAVGQCAEFARRTAAGEQTPLIERCGAMRSSIETAALEGWVPVSPP